MTTSFVINENLLEKALHISGLQTKQETVDLALEEFIKRRAVEDVIELFNSVEYDNDYDYKSLRGKR